MSKNRSVTKEQQVPLEGQKDIAEDNILVGVGQVMRIPEDIAEDNILVGVGQVMRIPANTETSGNDQEAGIHPGSANTETTGEGSANSPQSTETSDGK